MPRDALASTWINDRQHDLELARFVLEDDDFVNQIVSRAADELHRLIEHRSFAAAVAEGTPRALNAVVAALYLHLKEDYQCLYEYERAFEEASGEQRVRLPATIRDENRGTCLDLALLFASCLANAKLWPVLVVVQGHALTASWVTAPNPHRQTLIQLDELRHHLAGEKIVAVECTGFVEGFPKRPYKLSHSEACQEARELLQGLQSGQFCFALDIRRAWEKEGIRPWRSPQVEAVETPLGLDLLPIDERSPLVLGVAIDVSGTMQTAVRNDAPGQKNRLEGALDAVRELARRYRAEGVSPEVAQTMGLTRLFAYGFGFADRAAKYGKLGALAQRFLKDAPPVPSRVFRGAVRDLLEVAGVEPRTLSLKEIDEQWTLIEGRLWEQRMDLFGTTPLRAALEVVAERFATEFAPSAGTPHSALFLVSDGESKDGCPLEACRTIAQRGTVLLSCYLTGQDVAEPRRLYARPQPGWPDGAVTLFRCSSVLEEDSLLLPVLQQKGWEAVEGDRLFVQLNQSAMVSEFLSLVLDLGPGPNRS